MERKYLTLENDDKMWTKQLTVKPYWEPKEQLISVIFLLTLSYNIDG